MILLALSFIAGVLTVLAPCTLPLLPVIIGGTLESKPSKAKVLTIISSLSISIVLFTVLLKVSTVFVNIPQETWALISGLIIIFFGAFTVFPRMWDSLPFVNSLNTKGNELLATGYQRKGFWGDVIIGASLGPVFSSCSPTYFVILATVLPKSLTLGLVDLFFYVLGLGLMLYLIAVLGQKIIGRLGGISDTNGIFRKTLGVIFIILGVMIIFGIDKKIEYKLLSGGLFDITRVEQSLLKLNSENKDIVSQGNNTSNNTSNASTTEDKIEKMHGPKAPEIVNPSGFINTNNLPITIGQFRGKKVVLIDIWTYSCINCQRTLPYVESWYEKYKDMGLVVIGLHTPEFGFEKVKSNVEEATKKFGLTYPIVMDNDYSTWTAYGNQYWPRKYLINEDGEIIYDHIGEGNYDETEKQIQKALSELNQKKIGGDTTEPKNVITFDPYKVKSPEVYFGSNRNEYLGTGKIGVSGVQMFSLPIVQLTNSLYLEGVWNIMPEYATSNSDSKIVFKYNAKNVYIVASSDTGITIKILKDGKFEKNLLIKGNQLYTLIEGDNYGEHTLEIDLPAGLNAFTFTFG